MNPLSDIKKKKITVKQGVSYITNAAAVKIPGVGQVIIAGDVEVIKKVFGMVTTSPIEFDESGVNEVAISSIKDVEIL